MFPLGRALLPGELLPLRIFEPRYLEMMEVIRSGDQQFGVVLISRGWETGGGDDRYNIGSIATTVRDVALGESQRAVVAVGATQFVVDEWLPDDPYPVARITDRPDVDTSIGRERLDVLQAGVRKLYALASELGADTSSQDLQLPPEPGRALWRLASLTPLSEFDRQRMLDEPDPMLRIELLETLLAEITEELTLRLGAG